MHNTDCILDQEHYGPCLGGGYQTLHFGPVKVHLPDQGEGARNAWLSLPATPDQDAYLLAGVADLCEQEAVQFLADQRGLAPAYPCQLDYDDGSAMVPLTPVEKHPTWKRSIRERGRELDGWSF